MIKKNKRIIGIAMIILFTLLTLWPSLTKTSQKILIDRTLRFALDMKRIPDYKLLVEKGPIILSSENIDPEIISKIKINNLIVLTPEEIQEKANNGGDFLFLRFSAIENRYIQASISMNNTWATAEGSRKGYLSGGGFKLWYFNILGKWVYGPTVNWWIS